MTEETSLDGYITDWLPITDLLWGRGIITPGGKGNIARIVGDKDLRNKRVLDFGSGVGGGSVTLARDHGARVVGVDITEDFIEFSPTLALETGVSDRVEFQLIEAGGLPFEDSSFDVFYSSAVVCHVEDRAALFRDAWRVLKPGGWVLGYDWFVLDRDDAIDTWTEAAGFPMYPGSLQERLDCLGAIGFEALDAEDASDWYRHKILEELDMLRGPLFDTAATLTSAEVRDGFIEEWQLMNGALETGKVKQGYFRARKPD